MLLEMAPVPYWLLLRIFWRWCRWAVQGGGGRSVYACVETSVRIFLLIVFRSYRERQGMLYAEAGSACMAVLLGATTMAYTTHFEL